MGDLNSKGPLPSLNEFDGPPWPNYPPQPIPCVWEVTRRSAADTNRVASSLKLLLDDRQLDLMPKLDEVVYKFLPAAMTQIRNGIVSSRSSGSHEKTISGLDVLNTVFEFIRENGASSIRSHRDTVASDVAEIGASIAMLVRPRHHAFSSSPAPAQTEVMNKLADAARRAIVLCPFWPDNRAAQFNAQMALINLEQAQGQNSHFPMRGLKCMSGTPTYVVSSDGPSSEEGEVVRLRTPPVDGGPQRGRPGQGIYATSDFLAAAGAKPSHRL